MKTRYSPQEWPFGRETSDCHRSAQSQ